MSLNVIRCVSAYTYALNYNDFISIALGKYFLLCCTTFIIYASCRLHIVYGERLSELQLLERGAAIHICAMIQMAGVV